MRQIYLIKNQHSQYLDKSGEWVGTEAQKTFYVAHYKDEAVNQKVEYAVKQPELRLSVVEAEMAQDNSIVLPEQIESGQLDILGIEEETQIDADQPQEAVV